jgi:hypothetical protein
VALVYDPALWKPRKWSFRNTSGPDLKKAETAIVELIAKEASRLDLLFLSIGHLSAGTEYSWQSLEAMQ